MKRILFLFTLMLGIGLLSHATDKTISLTGKTGGATRLEDDPFTITFAQNQATTAPTFYSESVRLYYHSSGNGNSLTISCPEGTKMTKIIFQWSENKYALPSNSCSEGSLSGTTWTSNGVNSVTFKNTSTSSQARVASMTVTYEASTITPDQPSNPSGGNDNGTTTWKKVSKEADLTLDGEYIFVHTSSKNVMTIPSSGTFMPSKALTTINNDVITISDTENFSVKSDLAVVTFIGSSLSSAKLKISFLDGTEKGYYTTTTAKSMSIENSGTNASISWDSDWVKINFGQTPGILYYNSGSPRFLNYTSTQAKFDVYKKLETVIEPEKKDYNEFKDSYTFTMGDEEARIDLGAKHPELTFTCTPDNIVSIDKDGKVTTLDVGEANVTVTWSESEDWNEGRASFTVTVQDLPKTGDVTYDFTKYEYGLTRYSDGSEYIEDGTEVKNYPAVITLNKTKGNGFRLWTESLRVLSGEASITATVPGYMITGITLTTENTTQLGSSSNPVTFNDTPVTYSNKTYSWEGKSENVIIKLYPSSTARIATITINYEKIDESDCHLSWSDTEGELKLGYIYEGPILNNPLNIPLDKVVFTYALDSDEIDAEKSPVTVKVVENNLSYVINYDNILDDCILEITATYDDPSTTYETWSETYELLINATDVDAPVISMNPGTGRMRIENGKVIVSINYPDADKRDPNFTGDKILYLELNDDDYKEYTSPITITSEEFPEGTMISAKVERTLGDEKYYSEEPDVTITVANEVETHYSITFAGNENDDSSDSSNPITSPGFEAKIETGKDLIAAFNNSAINQVYNGKKGYGLKFGSSSTKGILSFNLSEIAQVMPHKIVIACAPYGSDTKSLQIKINGKEQDITVVDGEFKEFEYDFSDFSEIIKTFTIEQTGGKRFYLKGIDVYYYATPVTLTWKYGEEEVSGTHPTTFTANGHTYTLSVDPVEATELVTTTVAGTHTTVGALEEVTHYTLDQVKNEVTLNHAGTYSIAATVAPNATYALAAADITAEVGQAKAIVAIESQPWSNFENGNTFTDFISSSDDISGVQFNLVIEPAFTPVYTLEDKRDEWDENCGLYDWEWNQMNAIETQGNRVDAYYSKPKYNETIGIESSVNVQFGASGKYTFTVTSENKSVDIEYGDNGNTIDIYPSTELQYVYTWNGHSFTEDNPDVLNINYFGLNADSNEIKYGTTQDGTPVGDVENAAVMIPGVYFADLYYYYQVLDNVLNPSEPQPGEPELSNKRRANEVTVPDGYVKAKGNAINLSALQNNNSVKLSLLLVKNGAATPLVSSDSNETEATYTVTKTKDVDPTGVESVDVDADDEAEYFTLQGIKVQNPEKGIYIKVQNGKTSKVVL